MTQHLPLQSREGLHPPELVSVRPSSTLREVLGLLAKHRLHRVHVIDDRQRPVGIVTITDLLRVIVGCNDLLEALGPVSMFCACACVWVERGFVTRVSSVFDRGTECGQVC
jgi:hypothetical protein